MDRVPIIENPVLFDKVIADIQTGLAEKFEWLDFSFGRAERLVQIINGKKFYTPNVYIGRGLDYTPVSPDSGFGNFSFFELEEPQHLDWIQGVQSDWKVDFAIIIWFNIAKVLQNKNSRNKELIKSELINFLNGGFKLSEGSIEINKVYEKSENIYRGYSIEEIENQFLMHPFCGFKFVGEMRVEQPCFN